MTLDVGDVEVGAGSVVAFYVASTERLMAGSSLSEQDPSDDVVTLLGPTRYVHSDGGLFGSDYDNVTW